MNSSVIFKALLIGLLAVTAILVGSAVATGGSADMISYNLMWGYFLVAFGLFSAVLCAILGMASAPDSIKMTALSVGLVAVVIGISSYIASGHSIQIVNLGDGGFFAEDETKITEASVLVTYIAAAGAIIVALFSEVMGIVGGGINRKPKTTEVTDAE